MKVVRVYAWAIAGVPALFVGACVSAAIEEDAQEAGAPAQIAECPAYAESQAPVVFYAMDSTIPSWEPALRVAVVAGGSIPINVGQYYGPSGIRPVSLECIEWQIEPAGHASVSEGGERLTMAEDLVPGSVVELTAVIAREGERTRSGTLRISILDDVSRQLIGTWSFDGVRGCDRMSIDPPREVRFEPENGMSVAWTVFERYWDYWGRYGWVPETGAFSFEATGGNLIPSDVSASGQLVLEGAGLLALSGFDFGNRNPDAPSFLLSAEEAGCALVFRKQGGVAQ